MATGSKYIDPEPQGAPGVQITIADIEEELGPLLTRKEAILTSDDRTRIIGKWIGEEKDQVLGMVDVTETTVMEEPKFITKMFEKDIRYRVCIRLLRMFDTNRKTIGLTSFRASITEYRNDIEDLEMFLMEYFHSSVRGKGDSPTMTKTRSQRDRAERGEEGEQDANIGFTTGDGIYSGIPSRALRQPLEEDD